ncbi:hypothetical protein SAMN02745180_01550 [Sporanaerobacter acetigenes DSM 13106]|uniref:Uncharacterized protein n=1 Tax=Sporanaerobacter acetigenes DSM 13106 TaxID=1123281 RepID=A0A1M5X7R1_9FIRM|nr:hypothetical protein SAMN02745180_01550 [Sporanaerobacter acetigenes DSM 13106]
MWRATLPNRQSIREREEEIKRSVDKKNEEEPFEFTKTDILAMIIAAFQILLPIMLIGVGVFALFTYLFTTYFMK